jgi:hypothetical protein
MSGLFATAKDDCRFSATGYRNGQSTGYGSEQTAAITARTLRASIQEIL